MRIVATSDWHGELPNEELPDGDVLVIAGDVMPVWNHFLGYQAEWARQRLAPHLASLNYDRILLVGGNHDFLFQEDPGWKVCLPPNATYLCDESATVGGVKFHGTPWTPPFKKWAFMREEEGIAEGLELVEPDVQVLISHGPPKGCTDRVVWKDTLLDAGSAALRQFLEAREIPTVICGHIHEGYGPGNVGFTGVFNSSYLDARYTPFNQPHVIDIATGEAA